MSRGYDLGVHICKDVYVYVSVCMYVSVCVCIVIWRTGSDIPQVCSNELLGVLVSVSAVYKLPVNFSTNPTSGGSLRRLTCIEHQI